MEARTSFENWWRPLPKWLKWATALGAFPPWLFIAYSVLAGDAKNPAALVAFGVFALTALLHIMVDRSNRVGGQESGEVEFADDGE